MIMADCIKCGKTLVAGRDGPLRCVECWRGRLNEATERLPDCRWHFDRFVADTPIWKTECGREFDRLEGSEQPRKHLAMEFCPFCSGHIIDMTTDV
jgi:hypothetical protein